MPNAARDCNNASEPARTLERRGRSGRNLHRTARHPCGAFAGVTILASTCRKANSICENYPKFYRKFPSIMPATPNDLFAFLDRLGIAHMTVTHAPLFTVEQSQALRGTIPGGHTKNLFLKDKKDSVFLVVAPEDARVDLKTLHHRLGASRFSFGSAALLEEL